MLKWIIFLSGAFFVDKVNILSTIRSFYTALLFVFYLSESYYIYNVLLNAQIYSSFLKKKYEFDSKSYFKYFNWKGKLN